MEKKYVCLYSVIYQYGEGSDSTLKTDQGLTFADSFTDAVRQLEDIMYGEDLVQITNIELFDTLPVFSAETMKKIKEELETL